MILKIFDEETNEKLGEVYSEVIPQVGFVLQVKSGKFEIIRLQGLYYGLKQKSGGFVLSENFEDTTQFNEEVNVFVRQVD